MKVKVIFNSTKGWAKRLCPEVRAHLVKNGHMMGKGGCGATVIIGGDGTILYHKGEIEGILVGIGSKRSGICQLDRGNWKLGIGRMLRSRPDRISLLKTTINGKSYFAINEIAVRSREFRAIHTTVKHGKKTLKFFGDGVLVCTKIGSTAYNRSLLGPRLTRDRFCITPIAEIGGNGKSIVVDCCDIEISVLEKACCVIDGNEIVGIGKKIKIGRGKALLYGKSI